MYSFLSLSLPFYLNKKKTDNKKRWLLLPPPPPSSSAEDDAAAADMDPPTTSMAPSSAPSAAPASVATQSANQWQGQAFQNIRLNAPPYSLTQCLKIRFVTATVTLFFKENSACLSVHPAVFSPSVSSSSFFFFLFPFFLYRSLSFFFIIFPSFT